METLLTLVKILLFLALLTPFWALLGNWFPLAIAAILVVGIGWGRTRHAPPG